MALFLGIDFGTSGARAIAINPNGEIEAQTSGSFVTRGRARFTATSMAQAWESMLW